MRLIKNDQELLVVAKTILTEIKKNLQEKKCLVVEPSQVMLSEDKINSEDDLSFRGEVQAIEASECLRLFGALLFHLVKGESEFSREAYLADPQEMYTKNAFDFELWSVVSLLLSGDINDPDLIQGLLALEQKSEDSPKPEKAEAGSYVKNPGHPEFLSLEKMIKNVMGSNCFLSDDWDLHYDITLNINGLPLPKHFDTWGFRNLLLDPCPIENPTGSGDGPRVKDTHFLLFAPQNAFTLLSWRDLHPKNSQPNFAEKYLTDWYNQLDFSKKTKNRFSLYLGYKKILPDTADKPCSAGLALMPKTHEPFLAVELAIFLLCYYKKHQEYLFSKHAARCQDAIFQGKACLGPFTKNGLKVSAISDDGHQGISALWNLNLTTKDPTSLFTHMISQIFQGTRFENLYKGGAK